MKPWKNPPKEKIYEALSAIGDGRVKLIGPQKAEVLSSDRTKSYSVEWAEGLSEITSNDNASYWQGYIGYPIIAVLMVLGKLQYSLETARLLSPIQWKDLNKRFRNNYSKAVEFALDSLEVSDEMRQAVSDEIDGIMSRIEAMELERPPRRLRPPK